MKSAAVRPQTRLNRKNSELPHMDHVDDKQGHLQNPCSITVTRTLKQHLTSISHYCRISSVQVVRRQSLGARGRQETRRMEVRRTSQRKGRHVTTFPSNFFFDFRWIPTVRRKRSRQLQEANCQCVVCCYEQEAVETTSCLSFGSILIRSSE